MFFNLSPGRESYLVESRKQPTTKPESKKQQKFSHCSIP